MKPAAGSAIMPGLAAKLGGAVALALANGRNGGIVGVDDFAVGQRLALRQPAGLVCDPVMGLERGRELGVQARPLVLRQLRRAVQALPGRPAPAAGPARPISSNCVSVWRTSVTNTFPIPRHWRPKRRITFCEVVLELLRLRLQRRALGGALRGYGRDDLEDFFWALYRVAASLTRWLPCSLGKVSTTRCAGLTSPSSIAVAAWIASSSSINGSSRRLRNWASTSGSTKCSWEPSTWTSRDPTGIHHRQVGPQPATDLFIGAGQLMFQEFQRQ